MQINKLKIDESQTHKLFQRFLFYTMKTLSTSKEIMFTTLSTNRRELVCPQLSDDGLCLLPSWFPTVALRHHAARRQDESDKSNPTHHPREKE